MTLSIRRLKQRTANFGYAESTNFKFIESPSLVLAKKRNKLEEEIYKRKLARLEKETSKSLIKLSKNIYETNIELNSINYELKRNKLETIYKNYNFCSAYRNDTGKITSDTKQKRKINDTSVNNRSDKKLEAEREEHTIEELVEQRPKEITKEEKLNNFLTDLSTKSEIEINYMLAVTATATTQRPKTAGAHKNNSSNHDDYYTTNNRGCTSASSALNRRKLTVQSGLIRNEVNDMYSKNKAFNEINIANTHLNKDTGKKKQPAIQTIHEEFENENNKKSKNKLVDEFAPRSLTPNPYVRRGSAKKIERRRTSSLPRIRFEISEDEDTIPEESEIFDEVLSDSNSRNFTEASSICSKELKSSSRVSPSRAVKTPNVNLARTRAVLPPKKTKKKKSKPSGDASLFKINDLYDKSIENLERMSLRCDFDKSLDDDDWLKSLVDMKIKQRETIKKHRGKYRVCSAWQSKLISRHNIEITTRIRQNHLTRRAKNANANRFDMNKEKELFELTHKNLKDLMLKQIHDNIAKKSETTVKQYVQSVGAKKVS